MDEVQEAWASRARDNDATLSVSYDGADVSAMLDGRRLRQVFDNLIERDDVRARLGEIRCPALVIHGELDATMPVARGEDLCSRLPGCEGVFVVPGAGHTSNLENRDGFNQELRAFVVKHS